MKKRKIVRFLLCIVSLPFLVNISWALIYSASSVTCLESKPEDTFNFGEALAINDSYIAVGDPKANRVAIYSYDESKDKWSRTREIYPPKNSIIDRVGSGFGSSLIFHQNQLIIGAYSEPKLSNFSKDAEAKENEFENRYHGSVYSLLLDENNKNSLNKIALPQSIKLTGYAVTTFNNKIALGATTEVEPYVKPGKVLIINPTTLEVDTIIEPPSPEQKFADFGFVIDGNDEHLLIGSQGLTKDGGVLLIDEVEKIEEIPVIRDSKRLTSRAGYSVALESNFIVVGTTTENTWLFKKNEKELLEIDLIRFGSFLDATKSYVLISSDKRYGMPIKTNHIVHLLVKIDGETAKIKSKIRWKWSTDFKYEGRGIIHNESLLLSHKGKVVLQSIKNLPSSYIINRSFCKEK